mmetsp:Transcript_38916/g.90112  ORF Transcript_38916/g.90112 Transcript_38916/m.90112 type:complete len:136 (+) Transcript_38916:53-460(+)
MSAGDDQGLAAASAVAGKLASKGRAGVEDEQDIQDKEARKVADWQNEVRQNWRRNFSRKHEPLNQPQGQSPGDVSFTRWLCPTSRIHDRHAHHGIRNARMQEVWAVESRQRWHEKHPKPTWREKAVDLTLPDLPV